LSLPPLGSAVQSVPLPAGVIDLWQSEHTQEYCENWRDLIHSGGSSHPVYPLPNGADRQDRLAGFQATG
jgi:hypothetical protein